MACLRYEARLKSCVYSHEACEYRFDDFKGSK